eukprot:GFUD01022249.1.p1 GENE.GFUD01022249.1~~GFUD01022249.1.p1  ORF type:complete len:860 (+),score=226.22 GFUD01022249.1:56-2581(+)
MYKLATYTLGVQSPDGSVADVNDNWEVASSFDGIGGGLGPKGGKGLKNREASLTAQCLICTGAAAAHQHYGAVCCYSCRAFFRRGITRNYACVRGDNLCQVNSITRTNCKRCRYARCLAVGMKPELVDATLKRKQEEKRRQELIDIQHEMGIQTVGDMQSHTSQAVTGMMQLQQGGVQAVEQSEQAQQVMSMQQQAQHVLQAVQGLQQPLPRHLVQQQQVASEPPPVLGFDRSDESLLYQLSQALEGRKKVLLELRNGQNQEQMRPASSSPDILSNTVQTIPEFVEVVDPPRAHQPNQPLRQQTYYIFHPLTQTFEPITIAEFEENAVIEEVVVAEDYSITKQDIDENTNGVVNEHDYIELANETGSQIKRPRLSYEEKPNPATCLPTPGQLTYLAPDGHHEELERKPVIAPVIKERRGRNASTEIKTIKIEKPDADRANHTSVIKRLTPELIEETVRNHKNKLEKAAANTVSEPSHILEQVVGTGTDLSKVIEETIGRDGVITEEKIHDETLFATEVHIEQEGVKLVDIEELVDVCFEEELQKSVVEEENIIENEIIMPETVIIEDIPETFKTNNVKVIQRARKVTGSKKRRQSGSPLPLKKRRKMHHFNQSIALKSHKVPYIGFTLEEQLRLGDLVDRRVNLQQTLKKLMKCDPSENGKKVSKLADFDFKRKRELVASLSRSFFEEFQHLGKSLAYRCLFESWPAVVVAELAAWDSLSPNQGGVGLMKTTMLKRPWAENLKDEKVIEEVVECIGELLCRDSRLAVMFLMVVMTSQPRGSLYLTNKKLKKLQTDMSLFLFRYLANKMGNASAAERAHSLLGCLDNMHRCGDIYINKRVVV